MLDFVSRLFALLTSLAGTFFALPNVADPVAFRGWLQSLCTFATRIASFTATTIDDTLVKWLSDTINDDNTWNDLYQLIFTKTNIDPPPAVDPNDTAPVPVMCCATAELPASLRASADAAAIDPGVLAQFITALLAFIQSFRKK